MMREETKDAEGGGHGGVLAFKPARPAAGTSPEHPSTRGDESPRQPSSAATPLFGPAGGVTR